MWKVNSMIPKHVEVTWRSFCVTEGWAEDRPAGLFFYHSFISASFLNYLMWKFKPGGSPCVVSREVLLLELFTALSRGAQGSTLVFALEWCQVKSSEQTWKLGRGLWLSGFFSGSQVWSYVRNSAEKGPLIMGEGNFHAIQSSVCKWEKEKFWNIHPKYKWSFLRVGVLAIVTFFHLCNFCYHLSFFFLTWDVFHLEEVT